MKAIISDFDRTLLRTDKTISEYTCRTLKKCRDKGILLMAATARPERAVLLYQRQIGFDAITTLNGARILLPSGIVENGIAPSSAESILKKAVEIPGIVLSVETGDGSFSNVPLPEWNSAVFHGFPSLPTKSVLYKILMSCEENDIRREAEKILTPDTYMTVAEGKIIQIMSSDATKWKGIQTMLAAFDVGTDEAVYFGDDYDDIETIKNCGTGVAVSNAINEVLTAADHIIGTNDEDGVARYIEKYIL
ncbi:MAG: HAD family hydrolase [Roseburia sp.]|nr:HAD family hydrolase [Roseburia sp.]MCM1096564.1 HAD family hydrolase [Ruminococcus flavefaciens]MCM1236737.1 HAD family hydrolase [Ruminococcus flavefaciens]